MTKIFSLLILIVVGMLIKFSFKFKNDEEDYITRMRLYNAAALLLFLSIAFFTTDKPICYYFPIFCK